MSRRPASLHGDDTSEDHTVEEEAFPDIPEGYEEPEAPRRQGPGGFVRDKLQAMKLRVFTGRRSEYLDWGNEVEATRLLYGLEDEKLAPLVYLALAPGPGNPRDLLAHMDVKEEICGVNGFKKIFVILDAEYVKES